MENNKSDKKIQSYNEITALLVKERDYLCVVKGYCENEMYSSDVAARIMVMLETICDMHENLYDKIDDLIVSLGV